MVCCEALSERVSKMVLKGRTCNRVYEYPRQFGEAGKILQGQANLLNRDTVVNEGEKLFLRKHVVL